MTEEGFVLNKSELQKMKELENLVCADVTQLCGYPTMTKTRIEDIVGNDAFKRWFGFDVIVVTGRRMHTITMTPKVETLESLEIVEYPSFARDTADLCYALLMDPLLEDSQAINAAIEEDPDTEEY